MDQAIVFGRHDHLVGVVTHPTDRSSSSDLAVIMLTPGMLHNVGPFRMHVDLARRMSVNGIRSLRFDLSGIGESFGIGSAGNSIDRAAAETREAMDCAETHHDCKRFILFGLCSGADDSLHTAITDPRVIGLVAIDGLGYRTKRFYFHRIISHLLPRLFRPSKWLRIAKRYFTKSGSVPSTLQAGTDLREFPDRDQATQKLQSLVDRGIQMHFIYTGGISEYYNYEGQFFEMMPELDRHNAITTKFFPSLDHVALLCEDRELLVSHIVERICEMREETSPIGQTDERPTLVSPIVHPVASNVLQTNQLT